MKARKKCNIVLCTSDQLRAFELGCYGSARTRTPNIDGLACEGMLFEHAVCNTPLCVPARSSLISGQFARTCTGTLNNIAHDPPQRQRVRLKSPTLPEQLKKAGYQTCTIGKWHVDPHPRIVGYDHALFTQVLERHFDQYFYENGGGRFIAPGYAADFELAAAAKFIEGRRDEPFFLHYNITPPHMPFADVPPQYLSMYSPSSGELRENVWKNGRIAHDPKWFGVYLFNLHDPSSFKAPPLKPESLDLAVLTAWYQGLVSYVDDVVGRLVQIFRQKGLWDDTIFVFLSDHGDCLGSHHFFNKNQFFEEAIRIPLLFRCPGLIRAGRNRSQVAQTVDLMPTLLDLVEQEIPAAVQGRSLVPILASEKERLDEEYAIIEMQNQGLSVGLRTPEFLLGLRFQNRRAAGPEEEAVLFDLREDPFELSNRARSPEYRPIRARLQEIILDWNRKTPWLAVKQKFNKPDWLLEAERLERRQRRAH